MFTRLNGILMKSALLFGAFGLQKPAKLLQLLEKRDRPTATDPAGYFLS